MKKHSCNVKANFNTESQNKNMLSGIPFKDTFLVNPLAYTDVPETARPARSINPYPANVEKMVSS